jgi:DNA-binding IclR family transcriptional regulator
MVGDSSLVPALAHALAVLRLLGTRATPVPAAAVSRELDIPRSSVYHLLAVLELEGFVVHLPEARGYTLGVSVFELGSAYLRRNPLERLARPLLVRLLDQIGHTTHLGVLHGAETLYLLKESPRQPVVLVTEVGVRLPAHLTAVGRAMLARLPRAQVRALYPTPSSFVDRTGRGPLSPAALRRLLSDEASRGWSEEDGHVTAGMASVAAAVESADGRPVAAIGITFPASAVQAGAEREALARRVVAVAAELTRRLSGARDSVAAPSTSTERRAPVTRS